MKPASTSPHGRLAAAGRWLGLAAFLLVSAAGIGATAASPGKPIAEAASPPPVALPDTRVETLHSAINGIDYILRIGLPPEFRDDGDSEHPLLVLLDADYSFPIAQSIVTHLRERGDLPQLIVVGIAYAGPPAYRLHRTRDYTPTRMAHGGYGPEIQRHSGGGPQFAEFIARELLPRMRARYRTVGKRVLVGHSYGGLFGAWALLERPGLFDGYILASPSLWYDDYVLFAREAARQPPDRMQAVGVYAATGALEANRDHDMPADLLRFGARLSHARWPNVDFRYQILDDETHNSVFPRALSNGLRFHWPRSSPASEAPARRR
jgi:predicted alpha/beta superfamily hydrolase